MNSRENYLRAARFEYPGSIPVSFGIAGASWEKYPQQALFDLMEAHPRLFPDFRRPDEPIAYDYAPWMTPGRLHRDAWGCLWKTTEKGVTGIVVESPLADWEALEDFVPPDPTRQDGWGPFDWEEFTRELRKQREQGNLAVGSLRHGHTFLTLSYMRGYEELLCDMQDEDLRLDRLIAMVTEFNLGRVRRFVEAGVEVMRYPEDLGMQRGPMLSPTQFRRYIKPAYERLFAVAREAGCVIHMHSDGDLRELAEDLLDAGVQVLNCQDNVNGVDWMAANLKGRVCLDLSLDQQTLTPFGTPEQIDAHILGLVRDLGSPEGGLMLRYGLYPGVPLPNVAAVMDALEKYTDYYS
jgi:hypothetical protein